MTDVKPLTRPPEIAQADASGVDFSGVRRALVERLAGAAVALAVALMLVYARSSPRSETYGPPIEVEAGSIEPMDIPAGQRARRCVTIRALRAVENVELKASLKDASQTYAELLHVTVEIGRVDDAGSCDSFVPVDTSAEIYSGSVASLSATGGVGAWSSLAGAKLTYRLTFAAPASSLTGNLEIAYSWSGLTST